MRLRVMQRLLDALEACPSMAITQEELKDAKGYSTQELEAVGLTKADLKLLEREGYAIRGRLPTRQGQQVRWIFLKRDSQPKVDTEKFMETNKDLMNDLAELETHVRKNE